MLVIPGIDAFEGTAGHVWCVLVVGVRGQDSDVRGK
jgi:hypothetical protein